MLGKLLKYEIPALGRKLIPLYIAWLVASVLLGFAVGETVAKPEIFVVISALIYSMVTAAVVVMAVILVVQRYRQSLLGDEGYFNMVLPVTSVEHIANKTISALIWVVISVVAAALSGLLIALSSGALSFRELFSMDMWAEILKGLDLGSFAISIEFLILVLLSAAKSILAIYAALTIGHQVSRRVWLASIGAYIGFMICESIVGWVAMLISGNMESLMMNGPFASQSFMAISFATTILLGAAYFFLCNYFIGRRLNLD